MSSSRKQRFEKFHRDGSLWARGWMVNGKPHSFFVWFRKDGSKMRSGSFKSGRQTGRWTTYDRTGKIVKITIIK